MDKKKTIDLLNKANSSLLAMTINVEDKVEPEILNNTIAHVRKLIYDAITQLKKG